MGKYFKQIQGNQVLWFIRQTGLICIALFFLFFGIEILKMAFDLKEPIPFILTFFSSNLIILISVALLIGFIIRIFNALRGNK